MGDEPERTPDGHHIVVGGRKWRASDPGIPAALEKELVAELMDARRAVKSDPATARPRVHDAKVALGERGEPWWEAGSSDARADRLAATMRALLRHRAPDSTMCPSDAARVVGGAGWREFMDAARDVAARLSGEDVLAVTQRGEAVDPLTARGPVRLGRGPKFTP